MARRVTCPNCNGAKVVVVIVKGKPTPVKCVRCQGKGTVMW